MNGSQSMIENRSFIFLTASALHSHANVSSVGLLSAPPGRFYGGQGAAPNEKCAPSAPALHFGPAYLGFHLNIPVISLIQLHIVAPAPPARIVPPIGPHLASARTAPGAG